MKKCIITFIPAFLICLSMFAEGEILKETFLYSSQNGKNLFLDRYSTVSNNQKRPCIIFLFGGGFVNGERDDKSYIPYFNSLVENGNVVLSIDYRKGLSNSTKDSLIDANEEDFIKLFAQTLEAATEDLIDATNYAIYHAADLGIDTKNIIVSGSSAGAITALLGEYAIVNKQDIAKKLPENFRYAGVISFAGAIFSLHGDLTWKESPAPMLLFHGSADKNVPYNAIELGYLGFYGSKHIVKQLEEMQVPYYFYDEEYGNHSLSSTPMHDHLDIINSFIEKEIIEKKGQRIHSIVKINDRPIVDTKFSISDYILTNFPPK